MVSDSVRASKSVENGGVFDSVGLVFEAGAFACKASEPALDNPDGIGAFALSALDVAGCCSCSNAASPFIEDNSSKLLLRS
ncbi:hypothetical protein RB195_006460 [Necator americanus]|uniref:Uncharacterized protein n=1 Tax=Necator americanus TaxID=51031 RepID=A0ABR1BW87_NECAM